MKKLIIFILIACSRLDAATLHAILVCDTQDKSIGKSVKEDYHLLEHQLRTVSRMTNLKLQREVFVGNDADPSKVLDAINKMQVSKGDVIFFYFSGHGFRVDDKDDDLPYLFFSNEDLGCDFLQITQSLVEKEPRLLISLSDCCNNNIPRWSSPPIVKNKFLKKQYVKLFLETQGVLVGTAATRGQTALCDDDGGFFTISFFKSLEKEMRESNKPSWEKILKQSASKVKYLSGYQQDPSCQFIKEKPSKQLDLEQFLTY